MYFCLVFIWPGARLATDLRHVADNRLLSSRQNWLKPGISILAAAKINVCGVSYASRSDHGRQTGLRGILGSVIQKAHLTTNPGSWILILFLLFQIIFLLIFQQVHSVSKHQLVGKRIFNTMFVSVQLRIEFRANPEFFLILLWTNRPCGFRGLHFKTAVNTEYVWRTGKVFNFVIIIIVSFQFQGIRSCSWKVTI